MKREDIDEAAKWHYENLCLYQDDGNEEIYHDGFVEGAEWRINSVWHDVNEMPENNRMILIIMQYDIPTVLGPDNTFFKEEVKDRQIQRWAYVEDLITNTEE